MASYALVKYKRVSDELVPTPLHLTCRRVSAFLHLKKNPLYGFIDTEIDRNFPIHSMRVATWKDVNA